MAAAVRRTGWLRLVLGNMFVLFVILWTTNTCSSLVLDVQYLFEPLVAGGDARARLPNYPDRAAAERMFREFDLLHTEYVPYRGWRRLPFDGVYVNAGADGDRVHRAPDFAGTPRATVRFFGGSTMWGTGAADDETIPAQFNALHPDLRVYNHGQTGYVTRQNLARLINLVNEGEPMDLVVFYDGYNDVRTLCRFDTAVQGHSREEKIRRALRPQGNVLATLSGSTVKVVRFFLPKPRPDDALPSRCHADLERGPRVIRTLLSNWRTAREVARLGGAEFVAILQPVAAVSTGRTDRLVNDATFKGRAHELLYPELQRAVAAAGEDWMHDLSTLYDRDEYIFVDAAHVSPNGNRMMAERLSELLAPLLDTARP